MPCITTLQAQSQSPAGKGKPQLLLVEDDRSTASALRALLTHQGWEVELAVTLRAALAYLDRWVPDAVVLDLMLPDGDGCEVLKRVRQQAPQTRVVVTTGCWDQDRLERVTRLNPAALLHKPIDLKLLCTKLRA